VTVVTPLRTVVVWFAPQKLASIVPLGSVKLKDHGTLWEPMGALAVFAMR
jgi:hypothetical protein